MSSRTNRMYTTTEYLHNLSSSIMPPFSYIRARATTHQTKTTAQKTPTITDRQDSSDSSDTSDNEVPPQTLPTPPAPVKRPRPATPESINDEILEITDSSLSDNEFLEIHLTEQDLVTDEPPPATKPTPTQPKRRSFSKINYTKQIIRCTEKEASYRCISRETNSICNNGCALLDFQVTNIII